jgi:septum formation protein
MSTGNVIRSEPFSAHFPGYSYRTVGKYLMEITAGGPEKNARAPRAGRPSGGSKRQNFFLLARITKVYYGEAMITWQQPGRPVLLASQSPRRKEILHLMGVSFETSVTAPIDESALINPDSLPLSLQDLAASKARPISERYPQALVLGADTVVVKDRRVLGKPANREEARDMLRMLSGSKHVVMTAVALLCAAGSFKRTALACTDVFFRTISDDEIAAYLESDEYRDKAGAYAIQGRAMIFVDKINGCYYNVVGLPVAETIKVFCDYIHSPGAVNGGT